MRVVNAIVESLKREGVGFVSCYPTTPLIEAAAAVGIRPIVCRQERVGVGIADGFSRVTNGKPVGVFLMQSGPGAENAFSGVATAYSDSTPVLVIPLGHPRDRAQVFPNFSSYRAYLPVTKSVEVLNVPAQVLEVMRRAMSLARTGRPGPVMVELPADLALEEVAEAMVAVYRPVRIARAAGDPQAVEEAARTLLQAKSPVILAGQGVLYAEASDELVELSELLEAPVMTTMEGKSAFPEDHPLSLGTGAAVMTGPVLHFMHKADVVFGVGCSLTRCWVRGKAGSPAKIVNRW